MPNNIVPTNKMSMRLVLMAYTGKCHIRSKLSGRSCFVHLTGFSLSASMNVLKSEAACGMYRKGLGFDKYAFNAVRDCPSYDISVSAEMRPDLMTMMLTSLEKEGFHDEYDVHFDDDNTGLRYYFDGCRVTSFQFSVSENSACTASISFCYFSPEFTIENRPYNIHAMTDGSELAGETLMPYYSFGADYPGFNADELLELSFSFSHSVNPKYGCEGRIHERNAPNPMLAVFSCPSVSYTLRYLMCDQIRNCDYDTDSNSIISMKKAGNKELVIKYVSEWLKKDGNDLSQDGRLKGSIDKGFSMKLMLDCCYPESYSPEVGVKGSANSISISGSAYGRIGFVYSFESDPFAEENQK